MKLDKGMKATSRKNNPFTSAPAEAKVATKSVLAPTPATAKTNGATEKPKAAPTPVAETNPGTQTVLAPTPTKANVTTEKPQMALIPVAAAKPTKKPAARPPSRSRLMWVSETLFTCAAKARDSIGIKAFRSPALTVPPGNGRVRPTKS